MKQDKNVRARFAPSPTGLLHIGNARTALFNWLFARKCGGSFILRIEDTDIKRSAGGYTDAILEDLRWLGLDWDEGPDIGGACGPYKQSGRKAVYDEYLQILKKKGAVYPCYCTHNELEEERQKALDMGIPPRYNNKCRELTHKDRNRYENEGRKYAWRFKVPGEKIVVKDIIRGDITFDTSLIGDFIVVRQNGLPSFDFAVTADDISMGITHIIRGCDHLPNTPRHIMLWNTLEKKLPVFAHNSLTMWPDGKPMSKRHNEVSLSAYRKQGYLPCAVLNYLALLGWSYPGKKELFSVEELISAFSLEGLSAGNAYFSKDKLDWINRMYIRNMDISRLTNMCIPYMKEANLLRGPISEIRFAQIKKMTGLIRENISSLSQCAGYMKIFFAERVQPEGETERNILRTPNASSVLRAVYKRIISADNITEGSLGDLFKDVISSCGVKGKNFYMPLRIALTGADKGPELIHMIPLIGRDRVIKRLSAAIDYGIADI